MEDLWKNETDYIGVQLTPEEASLILKILGKLSLNQRKKFLSTKEEALYSGLYYALSA